MSEKERILFVDDEPRVLDGISRMLRSMHRKWKTSFAGSGQEALGLLAKEPFHVIVSDIRMPGMSGVELLNEVKERYPRIVRIALSGHNSKQGDLSSVGLVHQYLSKPCSIEILKSTIARTRALQAFLTVDKLRELVSQLGSLPSLPSSYNELMKEMQSPKASLRAVGKIVLQDTGMSTRIIQLVNSAFFGVRERISNPAQAVTVLGLDTVRALAMSVHVFSQFDPTKVQGFSLETLCEHGLAVGTHAKAIAEFENAGQETVDYAFIAGLLHDVGKLIFATKLPEEYRSVLELTASEKIGPCEAERQIIGATHAQIGAYLLGLWGFSNSIIQAIVFHHCPTASLSEEFTPLTAVHVANTLAYQAQAVDNIGPAPRIEDTYLAQLALAERLAVWQGLCREPVQMENDR